LGWKKGVPWSISLSAASSSRFSPNHIGSQMHGVMHSPSFAHMVLSTMPLSHVHLANSLTSFKDSLATLPFSLRPTLLQYSANKFHISLLILERGGAVHVLTHGFEALCEALEWTNLLGRACRNINCWAPPQSLNQ
jgi:hypothetical protein